MKNKVIGPGHYNNLLDRIANILVEAKTKAVREINKAQVLAYYEIGHEIIEFEQKGRIRADYGEKILERLSVDLTDRFGKGFSSENLRLMRKFYLIFGKSKTLSWKFKEDEKQKSQTLSGKSERVSRKSSIQQTVSGKFQISRALSDEFEPMLSWSHYCELLKVDEPLARSFYEHPFRSHIHGVVVEGASCPLVC